MSLALLLPLLLAPRGAVPAVMLIHPGAPADTTVTVTRQALGVRFEIRLVGVSEVRALELAEPCFDEVDRLEAILGLWSEESALRRLNADPGLAARGVDAELGRALETALAFCEQSGGAFDPTVGAVLEVVGYYADGGGTLPEGAELEALRARLGCGRVSVARDADGVARVTRTAPGMVLDLSGLTKGWAVDRVVERLRSAGVDNALVAAGPSAIRCMGPGPEGQGDRAGRGWPVDVPDGDAEPARWWLRDQSLATSGQRSFTVPVGERELSHIVDPRSALPVEHDTLTVSVRAPTCTEADMTSTALLVLGADAGARQLQSLGVDADGLRALAVCGVGAELRARELGTEPGQNRAPIGEETRCVPQDPGRR